MSDIHHCLDVGDLVVDRDLEPADRDTAVVVNTPNKRASEWNLTGGGTVATDNPGYPPNEPIVAVVYLDDLQRDYPLYSGVEPLRLRDLNEQDIKWYAFPEGRLVNTGSSGPRTIAIKAFQPSPYHARNFDVDDNREFIDEIRQRGRPDPAVFARVVDDTELTLELINGHKRVWASHLAGLDEIPCYCWYADAERGARSWAIRHLDGYTHDERAAAIDRMQADWGDSMQDVFPTSADGRGESS